MIGMDHKENEHEVRSLRVRQRMRVVVGKVNMQY